MDSRTREASRRSRSHQGEGPNWIFLAGSALLSLLSIRLGYKLKQVFDAKENGGSGSQNLKVNGKSLDGQREGSCHFHSNCFCFRQDEDRCCNHYCGSRNAPETAEVRRHSNGPVMSDSEISLPLVTVPSRENGVMWSSSPDRLELPQKPLNQTNCSDSPCVSESGSDIYTKREVIQKLRQQLKRRDDMILEMQDQIAELQNAITTEVSNSSHLQSLLEATNRDMFNSEMEIQKLRKAIADHCVGLVNPGDSSPTVPPWTTEESNGHDNGYTASNFELSERFSEGEKIEMLKTEVRELKELIEGKDYLLQSYKEQKSELSLKIKELQQRLDSQLPNIL